MSESTILESQNNEYNVGDIIYGDVIEFDIDNFNKTVINEQIYKIVTYYIKTEFIELGLQWKYNPFYKIDIKYYESVINKANINSEEYNDIESIPDYAYHIGDGNYIWKNILDDTIVDPFNNNSTNFPFVNQRKYVFNNIIIDIVPDLDDEFTNSVFSEIKLGNTTINIKPTNNLNSLNNSCLT